MITKKLTISGKRKRAIAKATIVDGNGRVLINRIPYQNFDFFKKLIIEEPIEITKKVLFLGMDAKRRKTVEKHQFIFKNVWVEVF